MRRLVLVLTLAAVVLSALSASAALLKVDGGTLQVFTYPAHIKVPATPATVDIEVPPPMDDCDDNCSEIESTAEDGENPRQNLSAKYEIRPGDTLTHIAARFGTTVEALVHLNGLEDPSLIFYGSALDVPHVGEEPGDATVGVSP